MKKALVVFVGLMLLAGCATAPRDRSGFLGEYFQKLEPGPKGGATMRWIKPGVDHLKYKKFMVDYVVFALAEDSDYKVIDGEEMKELGDAASLAFVNALKEKYPVVSKPGPDVARVKLAIVGLKQSRPVLSTVTTVIPVGLAVSVVKRGATGGWTGSGATQAELLVLDSMTSEVIGAAYDEYKAGFTERFSKWGSAEDAFQFWGKRFAEYLEVGRPGQK
jgi:hypothetical protein